MNHQEKEQRTVVVKYWWSKTEESLASAQRELDAKAYSYAMNRIYYAAFYAVSAAFIEAGDVVDLPQSWGVRFRDVASIISTMASVVLAAKAVGVIGE